MKHALATALLALPLCLGAHAAERPGGTNKSNSAHLPAATVSTTVLPGYDKLDVFAPHRNRPIAASIWYPAGRKTYKGLIGDNPVFVGTPAYVGAAIAQGRHPLILLSHGSGGNMDTISWLSSGLAQAGFMVLAVNHPGSTSGDSSPRRSIRLWERAPDLTAALDGLLSEPSLAQHVDTGRIVAAGFSLGAVTALQLGGLRTDSQAYAAYCTEKGESAQDCLFFAKGGVDLSSLPEGKFGANLADPRVSAVVAIEPGMSYAFEKESVAGNRLPTLLINFGDRETRWRTGDMSPRGSDFAAALPGSRYLEIAPGSHYTFLAECKPDATKLLEQEGEDPICDDPAGTDRGKTHKQVITAITDFLR